MSEIMSSWTNSIFGRVVKNKDETTKYQGSWEKIVFIPSLIKTEALERSRRKSALSRAVMKLLEFVSSLGGDLEPTGLLGTISGQEFVASEPWSWIRLWFIRYMTTGEETKINTTQLLDMSVHFPPVEPLHRLKIRSYRSICLVRDKVKRGHTEFVLCSSFRRKKTNTGILYSKITKYHVAANVTNSPKAFPYSISAFR